MAIDISFDFRIDSNGKDPDSYSPTLRRYHRLLWSKPLPGGAAFELSDSYPGAYLHHHSDLGEFFLSSDSVIPTFSKWLRLKAIMEQVPAEEAEAFIAIGYTMGGMMVFPSNQVDRKPTINAARGFNGAIADRLDLTLECIRRHYVNQDSPLSSTLERYADFFSLFDDFVGYVDFFLLQDLVYDKFAVSFFLPFDDFHLPSVPGDVAAYLEYRRRSVDFVSARNRRIQQLNV
jgi:hypothetical protein